MQVYPDMEVLRVKGVVAVAGREHQLMVQGVHDTYDTYQTKLWDPDTERKNTLGKYHDILTFGNNVLTFDVKCVLCIGDSYLDFFESFILVV